ncbi:hypothetical protein LIA77_08173 [Sarocladium implicatum]|nr:hypothetical protein LIA77_08173 [Sarocladium implicatum]
MVDRVEHAGRGMGLGKVDALSREEMGRSLHRSKLLKEEAYLASVGQRWVLAKDNERDEGADGAEAWKGW